MGTDIYLKWKGMNKTDKDNQITGFQSVGEKGYIRASIGMVTENSILTMIFPEKAWESDKPFRIKFTLDFVSRTNKILLGYLETVRNGKELRLKNRQIQQMQKTRNTIMKSIFNDYDEFHESTSNTDLKEALWFAKQVYDFVMLGYQLENKKLNPKVYISW